jgi:ABC-2 type transport system permease protein
MSTPASSPLAPVGRMLLHQTWSELLIRWRIPAFSVTSLALPILFFTFFGLPRARVTSPDGVSIGASMLASFGAYGVGSVMVYGFGIGVANERGQRMDLLVRATPLPPAVYLAAKVLVALLFALVSVLVLIAYGMAVGGIRQPPGVWGAMILGLLAGSLPFAALGFWIGYASGPHAAPAIANLVYLPLAFASGLFMPVHQLPGFVQDIAPYLPTYHLAQLAWSAVGRRSGSVAVSLACLFGYGALFLALAVRAYTRDRRRKFD